MLAITGLILDSCLQQTQQPVSMCDCQQLRASAGTDRALCLLQSTCIEECAQLYSMSSTKASRSNQHSMSSVVTRQESCVGTVSAGQDCRLVAVMRQHASPDLAPHEV